MNGQDGELNDDVLAADPGFSMDGGMGDEGDEAKVDQVAAEEKPEGAHDVKSKSSPCRRLIEDTRSEERLR